VKNKIYTSLLFGISIAFSVTGHTQIKPATKHTTAKTASTTTLHAQHSKKKTTTTVTTKPSNKRALVTSKSHNKKDSIVTTKPTSQKKSVATAKPITNKKQTTVSTKLKNNKQSVVSSKANRKNHSVASIDPATRKHTVISSKSIQSISIKPINHKKLQKDAPANLYLDDAESDQALHTNNDKQFRPILIEPPQITTNTAHVSIETSLFLDGLEAGLSKELILQLTDIFAWDIDFATNLRPGDQFTIVYGKKIIDGKETDSDEIIAAEFINQGVPYTAVRYIDSTGNASYYTPDGQSMQRAFLTTPVDFIKISSPFDMHRKHPILNRIRAHKGIDYAARTGTPVKTTGDGVVTFSGRKGAYGQVVIIQHNDRYETLYAHMSDFKKGLTVGNHVKQGDVIGYVGQTGLATGPHLHYEFHVDGVYRDPETVKIPHSMPISNALLTDFNVQTQPFYAQLAQVKAKSLFAKTPSAIAPGIAQPPASMQSYRYD
jgi:murein DD-endopeptidase MepM/ murein hydrolase activator NlpD